MKKIHKNLYIDMWSLVSPDQLTIDKEIKLEKVEDKKVKVVKTFRHLLFWLVS